MSILSDVSRKNRKKNKNRMTAYCQILKFCNLRLLYWGPQLLTVVVAVAWMVEVVVVGAPCTVVDS